MASPPTCTVWIYNATNTPFVFVVNQGPAVRVPAAAGPDFAPASVASQLLLTPFGRAGAFCLTVNEVTLTLASAEAGQTFTVDLASPTPAEVVSAQIHVVFQSPSAIGWMFLINGVPTGDAGVLSAAPLAAHP